MRLRSALIGAVSLSALAANAAFAQTARPYPAPPPPPQDTAAQAPGEVSNLDDIIVTANKRSESIDKVPLAIAAVSGETLREQGVNSVQDLSRIVPGLNVTAATFGTDVYTIRGVGFYDTTLAAVPAVSVYVDEAPLPFSVMTNIASLDPERVEVLMGPQGTLFGENSTGGAINYIAAKPTDAFEARLSGTVGNYETYNADGYISGPLSDTVGARFSFRSLNANEGWQRSATRNDRLGQVDQQQARLLLDWRPTDRLYLRLNASAFVDKSDMQAPRYLGYLPNFPTLAPLLTPQALNAPLTTGGAENADWDPNTPFVRDNRFQQVSLRGDYDISDSLTLTNIASYSHYDHDQNQDGDGYAFTNINQRVIGEIENFYDELRLAGDLGDRTKFTLGASYRYATVNQHDYAVLDIYTSSYVPLLIGGPARFQSFEDLSDQTIESGAVFGNIDYDLTDQVAVHAGARYTKTTTDLVGCSLGDAGVTFLSGSTNPPGECVTALATGGFGQVVDTLDEDNVSWRLGIDYKPTSSLLLYANISRGYKAGGYPVLAATNYYQLLPVNQEELTSYELGFKANLIDRTLRLSGAVFHYDYADKQIRGRQIVPIFGQLERLINIPESRLDGAEVNLQWRPLDGLTVSGGVSYIDSEIENFSNFDATGAAVNLDGASFPNAPSFRGNLSAQYDWSVGGSLNAFVGADYSRTSKTRGTLGFTPQLEIPAYDLLGAQVGLRNVDDNWRFSVWAKNLTDELYLTGANRYGEALVGYAGMPRTVGATLSVNF